VSTGGGKLLRKTRRKCIKKFIVITYKNIIDKK
jgi:shikimate kinase